MKTKHFIPILILLLNVSHGYAQTKSWNWFLAYSYDINNPLFETSSETFNGKLQGNSSWGMGQSFGLGVGYKAGKKITLRLGAQFKGMSYKNDSIGLNDVKLIDKTFRGVEIPIIVDYQITESGWAIGIGGQYYHGFQEKITYQLLNNNQRQQAFEKSKATGLGIQMQLTKQFNPDDTHMIAIGLQGQLYPKLIESSDGQFGFMNLGLCIGLTFL